MIYLATPECLAHLRRVVRFARERGLLPKLVAQLRYLGEYANRPGCRYDRTTGANTRCVLSPDWAPQSFYFNMQKKEPGGEFEPWSNGGLIFYDAGDSGVGMPQLSVRVGDTSKSGWEVHT